MRKVAVFVIKAYKGFVSPFLPKTCRYHPSCSTYCLMAIEKYGLVHGSFKGMLRVLRCNPFHPGGYDPVE